ncbi:MAG: MFS transporter [Thermodesulfobacteriota bacterium]
MKPRHRNTILLMSWLMYGLFYLNRVNIAPVIPLMREDLEFSCTQIGWITAAFYGLYTCAQLPAGYLGGSPGATEDNNPRSPRILVL